VSADPATVSATWFDGQAARGHAAQVRLEGGTLQVHAEDGRTQQFDARGLSWPERTRHGRRVLLLPGGGSLDFTDAAAFDTWRRAQGHRESWVVRAQQHWRATLVAVAALVLVLAAGYQWGVPWAAAGVVAALPKNVEDDIGRGALKQLHEGLLGPTQTPPAVQAAWRQRLAAAIEATYPATERPAWTLHFARGGRIGANALALPGGNIVVTDELLALLEGADDALLGVLAHEHGHVRRRHGMNALVRFTIVSGATSVVLGDFSALLAGVPALLAHLGYSRDAEREADADAARVLRASGRQPAAMVALFERLAAERGKGDARPAAPPIAFASHPADEDRIRFFREASLERSRP
jgi:Zn-dependent protease with chaperone function